MKEEIPIDIPKQQEIRVITTSFLYANLLHDIVTGTSLTPPELIGIQKDEALWKQPHMDQSL